MVIIIKDVALVLPLKKISFLGYNHPALLKVMQDPKTAVRFKFHHCCLVFLLLVQ